MSFLFYSGLWLLYSDCHYFFVTITLAFGSTLVLYKMLQVTIVILQKQMVRLTFNDVAVAKTATYAL